MASQGLTGAPQRCTPRKITSWRWTHASPELLSPDRMEWAILTCGIAMVMMGCIAMASYHRTIDADGTPTRHGTTTTSSRSTVLTLAAFATAGALFVTFSLIEGDSSVEWKQDDFDQIWSDDIFASTRGPFVTFGACGTPDLTQVASSAAMCFLRTAQVTNSARSAQRGAPTAASHCSPRVRSRADSTGVPRRTKFLTRTRPA